MSIEMDFREVIDCIEELTEGVNKARDGNTNERSELFAFYLGGSMATVSKLSMMLGQMAEEHVYKVEED